MKTFVPAALLFLLPATLFAVPIDVYLDVPFELGPGDAAGLVDGTLYLVFGGILEDSRCPLGAVCLWDGDAAAEVTGDLPGEIQITCVLHTYEDFGRSGLMGDYEVFLLNVDPYPVLGDPPIDPADYVVTLVITDAPPIDVQTDPWGSVKALYR